jgi:hypothetical protein
VKPWFRPVYLLQSGSQAAEAPDIKQTIYHLQRNGSRIKLLPKGRYTGALLTIPHEDAVRDTQQNRLAAPLPPDGGSYEGLIRLYLSAVPSAIHYRLITMLFFT